MGGDDGVTLTFDAFAVETRRGERSHSSLLTRIYFPRTNCNPRLQQTPTTSLALWGREQTEVAVRAEAVISRKFQSCEGWYKQTGSSVHETIGISVVVPSYNHGRFIDAAIRSLFDQEHPNLEIIVVDGSMDR